VLRIAEELDAVLRAAEQYGAVLGWLRIAENRKRFCEC